MGRKFNYWNEICISGAFYDDPDILKLEEKYINEAFQRDADFLNEKANLAEELGAKLIKESQKFTQILPHKLSRVELSQVFENFLASMIDFVPFFTFIISSGNLLERVITNRILNSVKNEQKAQEITIKITCPSRPNQHFCEEIEFLELASVFSCGDRNDELLNRHLSKYAHMGFREEGCNFWEKTDLLNKLNKIKNPTKKLEQVLENKQKMKEETDRVLRSMAVSKILEKLIKIARRYVWLRTYRSDIYNQAFSTVVQYLDFFLQQEGYKKHECLLFSVDDLITGKYPNSDVMAARKKAFAAICINDQLYHLSGNGALEFKKFLDDQDKLGTRIKGTVANRPTNLIKGLVRVVLNTAQLSKVKEGEIIVATMTTPNFVSAMKKASGFITDEGGILCHASILSREMNKPCIVGTGNATKILRDGDLIIANLETGEVFRVKNEQV
ncbi:hypothetical protein KJ707_02825 [Patescibacteria group bacterium]|nr:hypothetical protein [Patescibacteria group bacterium]